MPFPFEYICDLLQQLDDEVRSAKKQKTPAKTIIKRWFCDHRIRLDAPTVDACAVLSTLLPERRTDRVYGIQARKLQSIIGSALTLGASRVKELRRWSTPGLGIDLADCVQAILTRTVSCPSMPCRALVSMFGTFCLDHRTLTRYTAKCGPS